MNPSKHKFRGARLLGLSLATCMLIACGDKPVPETKEVVRPAKLMTINAGGDGTTREYPGTVAAT